MMILSRRMLPMVLATAVHVGVLAGLAIGQAPGSKLGPLPPPMSIPAPGPATNGPYAPQAILPGGIVIPLYPPNSPELKQDRVREPEKYNMSQTVHGRINSIVNIHNPSIEFHLVDTSMNTGAVMILAAGGGHRTLNVGSEAADFVPFFFNHGVNTVILRNRLRSDGYVAEVDAVNDAFQAIRLVRAYANELKFDPNKVGIMGFSAGAELSAPASVLFDAYEKAHSGPEDPLAGISARPDFVGIIYPGPSPFAKNRTPPPVPRNTPPSFIASGGSGDRGHAIWAMDYYSAMLNAGIPNIEMHLYGNGRHPGQPLSDGSRMTGGLTNRGFMPFGTWQDRMIDWMRDLGFLGKPGVETKAARDVAEFLKQPERQR